MTGGPAQSLCDAPSARGGSWGRDDLIVFTPLGTGGIQRVSAGGGFPVDLTAVNKGDSRLPVFLPDGKRFLYVARGGAPEQNGIYVASLDGKEGDGVHYSNRKGENSLYVKTSNGSGQDELLWSNKEALIPHLDQWSRDGKFVLYSFGGPGKESQWMLPMDVAAPEQKPVQFLNFQSYFGQISPDGHWMAFTSSMSGRREIYVRPFPKGEGEYTVSISGGQAPRWRADGKEMFFITPEGKMMAVPVKAKPSFEAGTPVALFDSGIALMSESSAPLYQYDVTADGKRFLIATNGNTGANSAPPLTVVTNWQAGVKK